MGNFRDIAGQKFGKLTVISFSRDVKSGNRYRKYWNCICECGNHKEVRLDSLTSGNVKSCGCLHKEISYKNLTPGSPKYEVIDKRLRGIWAGMKRRCLDEKDSSFSRYGGRGITICNDWLDFNKFAKWALSNGYKKDLTIDRIDNNKGYEPTNCRWITNREQSLNRRSNVIVEYKDKSITLKELSEITGLDYSCLNARYKRGLKGEDLIKPTQDTEFNNSKISISDVKDIRSKYSSGMTIKELSKIYPLTYNSIFNIVHFKTWKNI